MKRDMIILLKSIYENANDRKHHILKLNEIEAAFTQNKSKVQKIMTVDESLLRDKVRQTKPLFLNIAVFDVDLILFIFV